MHGLTGGGWKRSAGQGRSESCPGETPGRGAETYRRSTPPRQPPTLHRYGHSARRLSKIRQYARMRLALFITKKHRRTRGFGWRVLVFLSPSEFGLISLYGIVVAPRAGKPWREKPNAAGERRR
jgi:hypothetical protein